MPCGEWGGWRLIATGDATKVAEIVPTCQRRNVSAYLIPKRLAEHGPVNPVQEFR